MFVIDLGSRTAIYEQIILQVEENVLNGLLKPGDRLPSVRALSLELALNPNTVARAYNELEGRKIIYTVQGKGCFVSDEAKKITEVKESAFLDEFARTVKRLKAAGVTRERLGEILDDVFTEVEK